MPLPHIVFHSSKVEVSQTPPSDVMSITLKNHEEPGSSNARLEDTSETSEPLGPLLILPEDEPPNFKMSRVYIVEPMAMDTYQ
jgi:hypothetical protein